MLGSAVIAAFVTAVITYVISRKQGNLEYITGERKEWREKIRKIASKLDGASYKETLHLLAELKVRINAFGNSGTYVRYSNDAHIWELINSIEAQKPQKKMLRLMQRQMIEYLSLLLKDDWERSKREVQGDTYGTLSMILFVMSGIYFSASVVCLHTEDVKIFDMVSVLIVYLFMAILMYAISIIEVNSVCNTILSGTVTAKPENYDEGKLCGCYVICGVSIIVFILIYGRLIKEFLEIISCGTDNSMIILVSMVIYFFALLLLYLAHADNIDRNYRYNWSISKAKIKHMKKQNTLVNCSKEQLQTEQKKCE